MFRFGGTGARRQHPHRGRRALIAGFALCQILGVHVAADTLLTLQVSASGNDVTEVNAVIDTSSSTAWLGNGGSATTSYTGLRFTGVAVPPGSAITSSHLEVYSSQSQWISYSFSIAADASGNSPAFSSTSRPSQRTQTTSKVTHSDNVNWVANTWYSLDEMKAVVQEVVNRPDWQSGNSLSIVIKGTATGAFSRKFIRSFDGGAALAPRLVVNFTSNTTVPPTATLSVAPGSVTAGQSSTLSWSTTNATTVSIDSGIGVVGAIGSALVSPAATTTYTLTATNAAGPVTAQATLTVNPLPPTATVSVSPTPIVAGSSSTLSWSTANASSVSIDQGIGAVTANGSLAVSPTATTTYTITATGSGRVATQSTTLVVNSAPPTTTYFSIGAGFSDVIPHQLVRTNSDRLYAFASRQPNNPVIVADWTANAGLPAGAADFARSAQTTLPSYALSVSPAYDGANTVHVLANLANGSLVDAPFDLVTNTFKPALPLATDGGTVSGEFIGTSGLTNMFDLSGRLQVVYWTTSNHIVHSSYTYDAAGNALTQVSAPVVVDAAGSADHPSLAVSPLDNSLTVAWVSGATSPDRILARVRDASGTWGAVQNASNTAVPVWTSTIAGLNIDQGPSLVIAQDGTKYLAYIEDFDTTGNYGGVHFVRDAGSGWIDQKLAATYSHDPALALDGAGNLRIIGHGHPSNGAAACLSMDDLCVMSRNPDGSWGPFTLFAAHTTGNSFDASPSVKWSVVGWNRPDVIEFLFFQTPYTAPVLFYGRIPGSGAPALITVPNVVGLAQTAVAGILTPLGLALGTVSSQSSTTVPIGVVISQSPAANTQVAAGSAINLTVSGGVTVPNVVGQTQASAGGLLSPFGLVVGTVTQQSSATVAAGVIISQNPAANAQVSGGTAVSLVVSSGPATGGGTVRQPWTFSPGTCASQVAGAVFSTPQTQCGGGGTTFDTRQAFAPSVLRDVARPAAPCPGIPDGSVCYRMWYTGDRSDGTTRIGYAVSPDGVTWTRVPGTADGGSVLGPGAAGSFESAGPAFGRVMLDGSLFRMWYSGYDSSENTAIGYATSTNGRDWTRVPGPLGGAVLTASHVAGTFDADSVDTAYVLKDLATAALPCAGVAAGSVCYRMWYEGVTLAGGYKFLLGYATSADGLTWTRVAGSGQGGSILSPASSPDFDDNSLGVPVVLKDGTLFRMWYEAKDFNETFSLGSAASADGIHWTRSSPNVPVWKGSNDPGVDLSPHLVWASDVIKEGSTYRLWYSTSTQPISVRIGSAVMTPGSALVQATATSAGVTYTVTLTTSTPIPANGSIQLALPVAVPIATVQPVGVAGFGSGASLQLDPGGLSDAAAPHTTRGVLLVRLAGSEPPGTKTITFQISSGLAQAASLNIQTFDSVDVLERGTTLLPASGGGCTYILAPTTQSLVAAGGPGSASLTTGSTCAWTAASQAAWVTLTSPPTGTGPATVSYVVTANTGSTPRTGTVTIGGQSLTVQQDAATPLPSAMFGVAPTAINTGGVATLSWSTANATSVSIDQNVGTVQASGTTSVSPAATTTYTLTATNATGTTTATATLTVNVAPPPAPTATLGALPTSITAGQQSVLSWSTTGAATITIDQGIGAVLANGSLSVSPITTTTYKLTATNVTGTATASITVSVGAPPPTGSSLKFNGSSGRARFTVLPSLTVFTLEGWVKRSADTGRYETFFSNASSGYGQETFGVYVDGGNADCGSNPPDQFAWAYTKTGGGWFTQCSGVTAALNTWYHVAVTRDGAGTARIFVNGTLKASIANAPAPATSTGAFGIGDAADAATEYFAGWLDEVRISNTARYTVSFATQTSAFATDANTIALYHLDQGTGQTLADSSGNGRNGVLGTSSSVEAADPAWASDVPFP